MASIKRLKQDIDCLTFAVIDDCLNCLAYGKSTDEIGEIVQTVIDSRNNMRMRINTGKGVAKAERRAFYKAICKDLMISVDGAFSKLSNLVKKD